MKKIWVLICLLFTFNVMAQVLNLGAVLGGKTGDVICYVFSAPSDPNIFQSIGCDNKAGISSGKLALGQAANEGAIMAQFVGSGVWNLATSYVGKGNVTIFIFTKK